MIDIFDPLEIPASFIGYRASRLEYQAGDFGVRVKARWRSRVLLVTSDITSLCAPPLMPVVEDLSGLTLELGPPGKGCRYLTALTDFATHVKAFHRSNFRVYERVPGPFGRVHLILPFESTAVCGAKGVVEPASLESISCRACAKLVLKFQTDALDPIVSVALRAEELALANKALFPDPPFPKNLDSHDAGRPGPAEDSAVSA